MWLSEIASSKFTKPIVAITLVIATILIIYFIGKAKGKKQNSYEDPPNETDWGKNLTIAESEKIKNLTDRIHADVESWSISMGWTNRDCLAYNELVSSSDRITVGVANYYAQNYGEKLYTAVEDESFTYTAGCSDDLRLVVLSKLSRLNLK